MFCFTREKYFFIFNVKTKLSLCGGKHGRTYNMHLKIKKKGNESEGVSDVNQAN